MSDPSFIEFTDPRPVWDDTLPPGAGDCTRPPREPRPKPPPPERYSPPSVPAGPPLVDVLAHAHELARTDKAFPISKLLAPFGLSGRGWEVRFARALRGAGFVSANGRFEGAVRRLWFRPEDARSPARV
jgi:hypothetical protein